MIQKSATEVKGFTLIEALFVIALLSVLLAAVYPHLRMAHTGWQTADRRADIIQNVRVGMDKMVRMLREASSFTSVTSSGDIDGRIVFLDKDSNTKEFKKYNDGSNEMLGYVSGGSTYMLAGPITSLKFTGYEEDGVTEITVAGDIKSVEVEIIVSDEEEEIASQTVTSRIFHRND